MNSARTYSIHYEASNLSINLENITHIYNKIQEVLKAFLQAGQNIIQVQCRFQGVSQRYNWAGKCTEQSVPLLAT